MQTIHHMPLSNVKKQEYIEGRWKQKHPNLDTPVFARPHSWCRVALLLVAGAAAEDFVHGRNSDTAGASWLLHAWWHRISDLMPTMQIRVSVPPRNLDSSIFLQSSQCSRETTPHPSIAQFFYCFFSVSFRLLQIKVIEIHTWKHQR